jgi:hypothetical protein
MCRLAGYSRAGFCYDARRRPIVTDIDAKLNDHLSEIGLKLTLQEVAERLKISIEAARGLVEASLLESDEHGE